MKTVFRIAEATSGSNPAWWIAVLVGFAISVAIVAIVYAANGAKRVRFEVGDGVLKIAGDLYGRTIPIDKLQLDQARSVNLDQDTEYRLRWRTSGTGLPNYKAGWFKLANGEKALAFITDRTHVAYIPTSENYSVMLSVADPQEFIRALRSGK